MKIRFLQVLYSNYESYKQTAFLYAPCTKTQILNYYLTAISMKFKLLFEHLSYHAVLWNQNQFLSIMARAQLTQKLNQFS